MHIYVVSVGKHKFHKPQRILVAWNLADVKHPGARLSKHRIIDGESNRDLHMLQATRGAQFPMIIVPTQFPEAATTSPTIHADLEVQFAGQTEHYKGVLFQRVAQGSQVRITGIIPATCSDFKLTPPSFLTVPIQNEIRCAPV